MTSSTIQITVRFFAAAKDAAKQSEATIELPAASIADDVLTYFVSRYPSMKELRSFIRIAVNEAYVNLDFKLSNGDDVAIIPPVSGG